MLATLARVTTCTVWRPVSHQLLQHAPSVQTTTGCNTDSYNSNVVYTLHAIGVTTGRNTGVNTDQPVYTQLNTGSDRLTDAVWPQFARFHCSYYLSLQNFQSKYSSNFRCDMLADKSVFASFVAASKIVSALGAYVEIEMYNPVSDSFCFKLQVVDSYYTSVTPWLHDTISLAYDSDWLLMPPPPRRGH